MSKDWPTKKREHDYMLMRQNQNIEMSKNNKAENWFNEKLEVLDFKFARQKRWGYRIYDFWCHQLGIAVEVDGPEHIQEKEIIRDNADFMRSRILVYRVRNFNEQDAMIAIEYIKLAEKWNVRRAAAGMKPILT